MKKTFMAALVITVLLVSIVGTQFVEVAKANPYGGWKGPSLPYIHIKSPKNQTTYNSSEILLDINILANRMNKNKHETSLWIKYEIDGVPFSFENLTEIYNSNPFLTYGSTHLNQLSNGVHFLSVYGETTRGSYISSTVSFTICTDPPIITSLSVENKTYVSNVMPLNCSINEEVAWIGYSLDNQTCVAMIENTTLAGIPEGSHNIVVYAKDTDGNMGKSDTVFFTVITPTPTPSLTPSPSPSPSPSPTYLPSPSTTEELTLDPSQTPDRPTIGDFASVLVPASMIFLAIAVVGLLVYFNRRKS